MSAVPEDSAKVTIYVIRGDRPDVSSIGARLVFAIPEAGSLNNVLAIYVTHDQQVREFSGSIHDSRLAELIDSFLADRDDFDPATYGGEPVQLDLPQPADDDVVDWIVQTEMIKGDERLICVSWNFRQSDLGQAGEVTRMLTSGAVQPDAGGALTAEADIWLKQRLGVINASALTMGIEGRVSTLDYANPLDAVVAELERAVEQFEKRSDAKVIITNDILNFPIPVFGSPPSDWLSLANRVGTTGFAALGVNQYSDKPLMLVVSAIGMSVLWFGKGIAEDYRDDTRAQIRRRRILRRRITDADAESEEVNADLDT